MDRTKRKPEISALNVLLCLLVIFIHVSSAPIQSFDKTGPLFAAVFFPWRFASFVVPGFIFLGGLRLFLSRKARGGYGRFCLDRFLKILLPYIAWNAIYYLYFMLKGSYALSGFGSYLLTGDLVSPFYFIVTIVQFYALAPFWFALVKKIKAPSAIASALVLSAAVSLLCSLYLPKLLSLAFPGFDFKYNDRVLTTYLVYWVAGCFVGAYYEQARALLYRLRGAVAALFVLLALTEEILGYLAFSGRLHFGRLDIVHFFFCVFAVLFFYTLFSGRHHTEPGRERPTARSRLLSGIDQAAFPIYLSHCLVIFLINDIMKHFGLTSITVAYVIRIAVVYSATIALCIAWVKLRSTLKKRLGGAKRAPASKT